ncbi:MAG: MarR family transcriptional regulator [Deltaproteobacteria bacterium]|nr:MAG: MarR family transcriptional regulator [Deltaproteobacteria bacterium]
MVAPAVREAVLSGAPWMFPIVRGGPARGVPTAWGVPGLRELLQVGADADVPVWPHASGMAHGPALIPLYPLVPKAAEADSALLELLALFDALRAGRARERALAREQLLERLP